MVAEAGFTEVTTDRLAHVERLLAETVGDPSLHGQCYAVSGRKP